MALISQSDLETKLGRSLTTDEQNAFTVISEANQSYLEKTIGSSIENVAASTRYYDGGQQHLSIDPCTDVEWVRLVDDELEMTEELEAIDYQLEPASRTLKTMIRFRDGKLPTGLNNIAVKAKFSIYGDENIRNIVKGAMLKSLITEILSTDNIIKESIEGYTREFAKPSSQDEFRKVVDNLFLTPLI